jgi:hypothetical protein
MLRGHQLKIDVGVRDTEFLLSTALFAYQRIVSLLLDYLLKMNLPPFPAPFVYYPANYRKNIF